MVFQKKLSSIGAGGGGGKCGTKYVFMTSKANLAHRVVTRMIS